MSGKGTFFERGILFSVFLSFLCAACAKTISVAPETSPDFTKIEKFYQSFLLYASANGDGSHCYAFYFGPVEAEEDTPVSAVLSAGHCSGVNHVYAPGHGWGQFTTAVSVYSFEYDFMIGYAKDRRPDRAYFSVEEEFVFPRENETVVTVIEAAQIGRQPRLQKLKLELVGLLSGFLFFRAEHPVEFGVSGAPVVTDAGRLIGTLAGSDKYDPYLYQVVPLPQVLEAFRRYIKIEPWTEKEIP